MIAAVSPVSTPRRTSTEAPSSTSHSSFTSPVHLSTGLVAARISRPALDGFDTRGDDVFEQRIFDHSLAVGLDHRFVRAAWAARSGSGERRRPARAAGRSESSPRCTSFRAARGDRDRCRRRIFQAIATCRQSRATVERNSSRWPSRWASSSSSNSLPSVALVDHVGVEAVVGAVAIDHVFVGGAVQLVGFVVVPRLFVVDFVVGEGHVFGVVFVQIVVRRRIGSSSGSSFATTPDKFERRALASRPRHWLPGVAGTWRRAAIGRCRWRARSLRPSEASGGRADGTRRRHLRAACIRPG